MNNYPQQQGQEIDDLGPLSQDQVEVVNCIRCGNIPENYILLNCKHNFCLVCMAYRFLKGFIKSSPNNLIQISCQTCSYFTELDNASVQAVELVIKELIEPSNLQQPEPPVQMIDQQLPQTKNQLLQKVEISNMNEEDFGQNEPLSNQSNIPFSIPSSNQQVIYQESCETFPTEPNNSFLERTKQQYITPPEQKKKREDQFEDQGTQEDTQDYSNPGGGAGGGGAPRYNQTPKSSWGINPANHNLNINNQFDTKHTNHSHPQINPKQPTISSNNYNDQQPELNNFMNKINFQKQIKPSGNSNSGIRQEATHLSPSDGVPQRNNALSKEDILKQADFSSDKKIRNFLNDGSSSNQSQLEEERGNYKYFHQNVPSFNQSRHDQEKGEQFLDQNEDPDYNHKNHNEDDGELDNDDYEDSKEDYAEFQARQVSEENEIDGFKKEKRKHQGGQRQNTHDDETDRVQSSTNSLMKPKQEGFGIEPQKQDFKGLSQQSNVSENIEKKQKLQHIEPVKSDKKKQTRRDSSVEKFCDVHRSEELSHFCFTCENEIMCVQCLMLGNHMNHRVYDLKKGCSYLKERMNESRNRINEDIQYLIKSKQRLDDIKQQFYHHNEGVRNILKNNMNYLFEKIKRKEIDLIKNAQEQIEQDFQHIDDNILQIEEKITILQSIEQKFQNFLKKKRKNNFQIEEEDSDDEDEQQLNEESDADEEERGPWAQYGRSKRSDSALDEEQSPISMYQLFTSTKKLIIEIEQNLKNENSEIQRDILNRLQIKEQEESHKWNRFNLEGAKLFDNSSSNPSTLNRSNTNSKAKESQNKIQDIGNYSSIPFGKKYQNGQNGGEEPNSKNLKQLKDFKQNIEIIINSIQVNERKQSQDKQFRKKLDNSYSEKLFKHAEPVYLNNYLINDKKKNDFLKSSKWIDDKKILTTYRTPVNQFKQNFSVHQEPNEKNNITKNIINGNKTSLNDNQQAPLFKKLAVSFTNDADLYQKLQVNPSISIYSKAEQKGNPLVKESKNFSLHFNSSLQSTNPNHQTSNASIVNTTNPSNILSQKNSSSNYNIGNSISSYYFGEQNPIYRSRINQSLSSRTINSSCQNFTQDHKLLVKKQRDKIGIQLTPKNQNKFEIPCSGFETSQDYTKHFNPIALIDSHSQSKFDTVSKSSVSAPREKSKEREPLNDFLSMITSRPAPGQPTEIMKSLKQQKQVYDQQKALLFISKR